jgi:ABC-type amino acid transport substrate-binding protein
MAFPPRRLGTLVGVCIFLGLMGGAAASSDGKGRGTLELAPPLSQRQPLTVGVFTDAYPYSYLDSEGHIAGFSADVLDAVTRAVNLQIKRVEGPTDQIRARFQHGEFDLLQYHGITPGRLSYAEFSTPFLSLQGCV